MADNTREILNKLLVEVQAKLAKSSPTPSRGGPTFQINLNIQSGGGGGSGGNASPRARGSIASRAAADASGTARSKAGTTLQEDEKADRNDWFSQEGRRQGFFSSLNPIKNWARGKRDEAYGQFGHGGRMVQHYLDLMGQDKDKFGNATMFAKGAQGVAAGLATAGAVVNFAANDAGNIGAAVGEFLKSATGIQALGEGVASYFHAFGQAARDLIAEVTAPAKGFADANAVRIERQRLGQGKEDNSDLGAIYQAEREQEAGMQKIKGAIGANKSEEEWAGFAKDPGKFRQFIIDIVGREVEKQVKNFLGNFRL